MWQNVTWLHLVGTALAFVPVVGAIVAHFIPAASMSEITTIMAGVAAVLGALANAMAKSALPAPSAPVAVDPPAAK